MAKYNTKSILGKVLKAGATKATQMKKGLPKDIAKMKVDSKMADKAKKIAKGNKAIGKTLAKTPGVGKLFETVTEKQISPNTFKKVKDFSAVEPINKAKKVALPMLASAGLGHHIANRKKKEKQKILDEINKKGGKEKMADISRLLEKTAADLEKSAQVIKDLKEKNEDKLEKIASLEQKNEQRDKAFDKLMKMAKMEQIPIEDVPEQLEKLSSMDKEDFEIEMRVMDKVSEKSLLDIGDLSKKAAADSGDPLFNFVMNNSNI